MRFTKGLAVLCSVILFGLVSGCGLVPDDLFDDLPIDELPDFEGEEDVTEHITRTSRITHDGVSVSNYTASLECEAAKGEFHDHLEDEGYQEVEEDLDQTFFVQHNGAQTGGTTFEDDDHYKYVYISSEDEEAVIVTIRASKEDYEEEVTNERPDHGDYDEDFTMPDDDKDEGEEPEIIDRYPGSVMTEHHHMIDNEHDKYWIVYVVEDSLDDVYDCYVDILEDTWNIENRFIVPDDVAQVEAIRDEYYTQITMEVINDDFITIYFHLDVAPGE